VVLRRHPFSPFSLSCPCPLSSSAFLLWRSCLRLLENLVGKGEVSAEKGLESGSLGGVLGKDVELQVERE
jgi:hypothetical protein